MSPIGIYTLNADGVIDSFNPKMVEMAGSRDATDAIGLNVFTMKSYEQAGLYSFFRKGLSGNPFEAEVKYLSQSGNKESWRHYRGVPLFTEDRRVKGLLLIVEDVTERILLQGKLNTYTNKLEDEVQKRTAKLFNLEKFYETMVEKTLVGTSIIQDGVYKYVNPFYLKIFGYDDKSELIGKSWMITIFEDDIQLVKDGGIQERMEGKGGSARYTVRGIKKDGTVVHLEISSTPTLFDGKPAIIGTLQDISARVEEEAKEKKHLQEVEKMNRLMIDREIRMSELKKRNKEIEDLLSQKSN